jgi:hypothetical protein
MDMKSTLALTGMAAVLIIAVVVMVSGKPNETPKQHPETTPPSQQTQSVDPKSVGQPKPQ